MVKTMKTTEQWWEEVSNDDAKMIDWLKDQYHGEVTAAERIKMYADRFGPLELHIEKHIANIIKDERTHAEWVRALLLVRGIKAEVLTKEERYWKETLPPLEEINTFEYFAAVAHLAETMRLDRIELLRSNDKYTDIAEVFENIYEDEKYHAYAFGLWTTPEALEIARKHHQDGMNAIGLIA